MPIETTNIGKDFKAITEIPGWTELLREERNKVRNVSQAYKKVPLIYRGVKLRATSLAQTPVHLYTKGTEKEVEWNFSISPRELLMKTEMALLIWGKAFWLPTRSKRGKLIDLEWINPLLVEVMFDKETQTRYFVQKIEGRIVQRWEEGELIYFYEVDPDQDIREGTSAVGVALGAGELLHYSQRFAALFFEGGAMPVTLLGLHPATSEKELERVENRLRSIITGIRNAFSVLGVRSGSIEPKQLTPPLKELVIPELSNEARGSVALALGIPQTMLEDAANYATATEHRLSFWQDTVRPSGDLIAEVANRSLFYPAGLEMVLRFEDLDIFQEDENQRADALEKLTNSGVPVDLALEILGFELREEQWERLKKKLAEEEARQQALISNLGVNNNSESPQPPPGQTSEEDEEKSLKELKRAEFLRWKRKTLRRMKAGNTPWSDFASDLLTDEELDGVSSALEELTSTDWAEVKRVFSGAIEWLGY